MELKEFNIIFEKLHPAGSTDLPSVRELLEIREISAQADELADLRELAAEVSSPEPQLFTAS